MISIKDLNEQQLEQFHFNLRAEGFKIKVPQVEEALTISQTFFIENGIFYFNNEDGEKKPLIYFNKFNSLEDTINKEKRGELQFFKRGVKIDFEKLNDHIVPYFIFSMYNSCDVIVLINVEDPKAFILCQICSLIKFLKETLGQDPETIKNNVNKILEFDKVLEYPSMKKIDLEKILKDILNFF